ncbi:Glyoxalase/bleomycin resistance protein/ dioxygenase [Chaetomidium leptoderma]|uniref:Glyoxalase/bleomycin resistance protein/ dioxygenase n=1 Tax=Chaetomidium leptoderma TaxID=669021 RepID=A0AAN6ZX73_9PEZI|nr:Glyoxalase/bleomycin resistance protein/ dioxygenase [Chaetomidium leptoderma]
MTIAHTGIKTPAAVHPAVVAWYEAALAPLGYTKAVSILDNKVVGFADATGAVDWWVGSAAAAPPGVAVPVDDGAAAVTPTHTAFLAKDRATVEAFHKAGVAAGGKCNGPPGVRARYSPTYFAAFVRDPVGNNMEAVCMTAEE